MNAHDFTIWLQGYFAALGDEPPTHKDWRTIRNTLEQTPRPTAVLPGPITNMPIYPPGARGGSPVTFGQKNPLEPTL